MQTELVTMEKADFIVILDKLNKLENSLNEIKEAQQPEKKLILSSAREIANFLNIPIGSARKLIKLPDFPRSITPRKGVYKVGKWRACEVERFFNINKRKV